jgi:NADH-quinone oxidoreductase subunit C
VTPGDTAEALQARFGDSILQIVSFRAEVTAVIAKHALVEIARHCRDELTYRYLSDVSATDWLDRSPRFDVVYQLLSLDHWVRFRLKVQVEADEAIPTVIPVWEAANWPEREVWDLFGIPFEAHPDLRRIMLPDDWVGHPLRKDYPQSQLALPRPKTDKTLE